MKNILDSSVESSALSRGRSSASTSTTAANNGKTVGSTILDGLFPLIDEIYKKTLIPRWMYYIFVLFFSFQSLCITMCPSIPSLFHFDKIAGHFTKIFFNVCMFTDMSFSRDTIISGFIVCCILALIFIIVLIMQAVIHQKYLIFFTWSLYISRFIFEFVPLIVLCPMGNLIGMIFQKIVEEHSAMYIVMGIFSVLIYAMFLFAHYVSAYFGAKSTYIPNTIIACWDGLVFFLPPFCFSVYSIICYIVLYFQKYMFICFIGFKILSEILVLYKLTYFPFITLWMNAFLFAALISMASMDCIYIIQIVSFEINYLIQFGVFFGILIVSFIILKYIFALREKKVKGQLTYDSVREYLENDYDDNEDEENVNINVDMNGVPSYEAISCYYRHLGIDCSFNKANMYLQVGIAERSPLFLDWSLMKFISEYHTSVELRCKIAHMIAFFPSESRRLSYYLNRVLEVPNLNYSERFMVYELDKVRKIRQSSASNEVTRKLLELKNMSMSCYSKITQIFTLPNVTPDQLYDLKEQTERTESLYQEATTNWPNNVRIYEDYSRFLIECSTNYTEGVKMKHKANLIELGKNFVVDVCFKSMIRCYPQYLKSNVLDVKGRFILNKGKGNGSQAVSGTLSSTGSNSGMGSNMSTGTIDGELDIEIEDQVARTTLSSHKLRLALQKCLASRKSKYTRRVKILHTFALFLLMFIALFLYAYLYGEFDERRKNMDRQLQLNSFRYGYDAAFGTMIVDWTTNIGLAEPDLLEDMKQPGPVNKFNLVLSGNTLDEISRWIDFSRDNLYSFIVEMVGLAIQGFDISTTYSEMIKSEVSSHVCSQGVAIDTVFNTTLRNAFVYLLYDMNSLILDDSFDDWVTNNYMCQVIKNSPSIIVSCRNLARSIANDQERQKKETDEIIDLLLIVFCVGYFILVVPGLIYNYYKSFKELEYLIGIVLKTEDSLKEEATKSISRDSSFEENAATSSKKTYVINKGIFVVLIVLVFIIGLVDILAVCLYSRYTNELFVEMNQWLRYGVSRGNYMFETLLGATLSIMLGHYKLETTITDLPEMRNFTENAIYYLNAQNTKLLRGDGTYKSCIGESEELDRLNVGADCIDERGEEFHDSYKCSSIDQSIGLFIALAKEIINHVENQTFSANSTFYHMFHIANVHLADKLFQCAEVLASLSDHKISEYHVVLNIITWSTIAVAILIYVAFNLAILRIDTAYKGFLQVMRRLPPRAITSNNLLMCYVMNKDINKKTEHMTASMSVIHLSYNPVVCISKAHTIDVANDAVTDLLGFTNDQLLGQSVTTIIPEEKAEEMYSAMSLMENGQSSLVIDKSVMAITDNELFVPVHVTILGITNGNSPEAKSFALILRDETELLRQQKEAEEAKEQSEKLLFQILPRDIVTRLNANETDISFVVQSSSIIFIDIVKFSDYSASLSPSQIMVSLSTIFAKFDSDCAAFNSITKIKLIGDVYMAASGLFDPDMKPQVHASQTVQFGLKAIESLEELNTQLEANLKVRVGVNTGGPIIAGVLGTDKPTFDIIGDAINVASRLQSTDVPDLVQISQTTYEAIQGMPFNIESRGEIELKGKGKQRAYIVRPVTASSMLI